MGVSRHEGLPIGTRVRRGARTGVVMHHEPEHSRGSFPVRFEDGVWEKCDASEVTVLAPPASAPGPVVNRGRPTRP